MIAQLDLEDDKSIQLAADAGLARFGRISALVNKRRLQAYGSLEATPFEKIRRQFNVNVLGLLATTQALLPHFRTNRSGTIVNISSIGGRMSFPLGTFYHGTKFAVEGLSEALQYELGPIGIRVQVVEPGGIKTDFGGRSFDFSNDTKLSEYQPLVERFSDVLAPMMAQGSSPESIANVVYTERISCGMKLVRMPCSFLASRRAKDDAAFFAGMKTQFGLE